MARYTDADLDRVQAKARPRGVLPRLPAGRDPEALQQWLTIAFRPPDGYKVESIERHGRQRLDPCTLTMRNGRDCLTYRFMQQADLVGSRLRPAVLAASDGLLDVPHLSGGEQEDVWSALVKLGRVMTEVDERDETRKWVEQMVDVAAPLRGYTLVPDSRHDALMALRNLGGVHPSRRACACAPRERRGLAPPAGAVR